MYKSVKYITKIPYQDISTYYLFCKPSKVLLPIEIDNEKAYDPTPSVYNTIKRIVIGMGARIKLVKIYRFSQSVYYAYLTLTTNGKDFDVNISLEDAMEISKEARSPIYVKEEIINQCGIEITKEIIEKALAN